MLTIPIQVDARSFDLLIVLEDENIERMKAYDPGQCDIGLLPIQWSKLKVRRVVLLYATPEEVKRAIAAKSREEILKIVRELNRGWKYKPQQGDSDMPYQAPAKN